MIVRFPTFIVVQMLTQAIASSYLGAQDRSSIPTGPRALAIAAMIVDEKSIDRQAVVAAFETIEGEHSLADIKAAAERLGLVATIVKYDKDNPRLPSCPVVIAIESGRLLHHVAVLHGRDQFIDYPRSPEPIALERLETLWTGEGSRSAASTIGI